MNGPETRYKEFINSVSKKYDPEIRVNFVNDGKHNLDLLSKPDKERIGEQKRNSNDLSLQDCFSAFNEEELLTGDNQWYCSKCKDHVDAFKKMDLYKLPNVLVVQLKRFIKKEQEYSFF